MYEHELGYGNGLAYEYEPTVDNDDIMLYNVFLNLGNCSLELNLTHNDIMGLTKTNSRNNWQLLLLCEPRHEFYLYTYDNLNVINDSIENSCKNVKMWYSMFPVLLECIRWNISETDVNFKYFESINYTKIYYDIDYYDNYDDYIQDNINNEMNNIELFESNMMLFIDNLENKIEINKTKYKTIHFEKYKNVLDSLIDVMYHPDNIDNFKNWGLIDNEWNM